MTTLTTLAVETDTKLAELYERSQRAAGKIEQSRASLISMAGAEFYYHGRRRVTDLTFEEAMERLTVELEKNAEDGYGYALLTAPCSPGASIGSVRSAIERIEKAEAELQALYEERLPLDETFEQHRWSRFFLVTSSKGHIHSSMSCSTCYPRTIYGWLPNLSGRTEAEAVEEQGPALCSVCFPSAPLEWTAEMISKATAAKRSKGG